MFLISNRLHASAFIDTFFSAVLTSSSSFSVFIHSFFPTSSSIFLSPSHTHCFLTAHPIRQHSALSNFVQRPREQRPSPAVVARQRLTIALTQVVTFTALPVRRLFPSMPFPLVSYSPSQGFSLLLAMSSPALYLSMHRGAWYAHVSAVNHASHKIHHRCLAVSPRCIPFSLGVLGVQSSLPYKSAYESICSFHIVYIERRMTKRK